MAYRGLHLQEHDFEGLWFLTQAIPSAWLRICLHVTII